MESLAHITRGYSCHSQEKHPTTCLAVYTLPYLNSFIKENKENRNLCKPHNVTSI